MLGETVHGVPRLLLPSKWYRGFLKARKLLPGSVIFSDQEHISADGRPVASLASTNLPGRMREELDKPSRSSKFSDEPTLQEELIYAQAYVTIAETLRPLGWHLRCDDPYSGDYSFTGKQRNGLWSLNELRPPVPAGTS